MAKLEGSVPRRGRHKGKRLFRFETHCLHDDECREHLS